jgi:murein DD-endopeptidase MepM/ murein hydrolase activator NlpD
MHRLSLALLVVLLAPLTSRADPVADPDALRVAPTEARPGQLVVLSLPSMKGRACPSGFVGERAVRFHLLGGKCQALLGLPVEQEPGEMPVRLGSAASRPLAALTVLPAAFNVRELTVAKKFVQPPASVKKRMQADREAFARAFSQKLEGPLFSSNFDWPRRDVMTAPFGDLRTFNGKKQSQHFGMDIDGRTGDPIVAANDGVVVMVRDNYAAGQTVMLHHGLDLYTTYFHLSEMDVKVGQKVKKGELLGKVGKTGRVTGAHLHFGVKVGGLYVDPTSVLQADLFGEPLAAATPEPGPLAPAAGGSGPGTGN